MAYLAHLASTNLMFLLYIFSYFCQSNDLNIHRTDLYEICRDGRTLAVDERHGNQFF